MEHAAPRNDGAGLELWGGIECTRNRVGETWFDQLTLGGHWMRRGDLARIAELGITTVRYPALWELVASEGPRAGTASWGWLDDRLALLRELGIAPVVGFMHHGSGPRGTSLLDPGLPAKLAEFGAAFAERYRWVEWFTPINEPLTTARFSCLYGHWYPHARDDESFVRSLIIQCQAVCSTLQAIRGVTRTARLLQTEDGGRVYGPTALAGQVRFENRRRWLTFDLLCGRVDGTHPLWRYLRENGASEADLDGFLASPCPPDALGLNYYVTSDRALDPSCEAYPPHLRGGNGRQHYADTEAVRLAVAGAASHSRVLKEVWDRYRLPLVLSEVHLAGHREDQLRWLQQAWTAAVRARARGIDVRALTVWSLFGAHGWDTLVTRLPHAYEAGAFDIRGRGRETPRPTAVAHAVRDLARTGRIGHPVAAGRGWWRRPRRAGDRSSQAADRPLLLVGSGGTLGSAFGRACAARALHALTLPRHELDATDAARLDEVVRASRPWVIVNAAGFCDVDAAERDPARCLRANVAVPEALAAVAAAHRIPLVTFSSDLVFDGRARTPYVEGACVGPLNVYGRAKATAERTVGQLHGASLIVRTSAFFGPWDRHNFAVRLIDVAREGREVALPTDVVVSATYVPDLVDAVLDLAIDGAAGVWHLTTSDGRSWFELGTAVARQAGIDTAAVVPTLARRMPWTAPRPVFSALTSLRANLLPGFDSSVERFVAALPVAVHTDAPRAQRAP